VEVKVLTIPNRKFTQKSEEFYLPQPQVQPLHSYACNLWSPKFSQYQLWYKSEEFYHHSHKCNNFTLMSVIFDSQKCLPDLTENLHKSEGFHPPQPQVKPLYCYNFWIQKCSPYLTHKGRISTSIVTSAPLYSYH
jgi:hypothetical protein